MCLVRLECSGLLMVICVEPCAEPKAAMCAGRAQLRCQATLSWGQVGGRLRFPRPLVGVVSCCLPRLAVWLGVAQAADRVPRWGLEELTARWLLPECPLRPGLLLPPVLPGMQSWELHSSSGARSKQPRRQTRLLEGQTSVWTSGLQTGEGLRQESKEMGDFPDSRKAQSVSNRLRYAISPLPSLPASRCVPLTWSLWEWPYMPSRNVSATAPSHRGRMVLHAVTQRELRCPAGLGKEQLPRGTAQRRLAEESLHISDRCISSPCFC